MSLLQRLSPDELTPARVWSALDAETRRLAAECLYRGARSDETGRREADAAIAATLRFRDVAVRRLPVARRVGYLVNAVRPDDSLASSLLLALHLERREPLLAAFLEQLGIRHERGVIAEDEDVAALDPARLARAVDTLYAEHPRDDVELYLASLLAMEPEMWVRLSEVIRRPPSPSRSASA